MKASSAQFPTDGCLDAPDLIASLHLASGERWFVVQTLAKNERRAQFHLVEQGFRTFLPTAMRAVRHARKVSNVKTAVFPGYFFVILDLERDRWRSVNGTPGVCRLIQNESAPTPAPPGVVEALLEYLDASGVCRFDRDLVVGQRVRIVSGPLVSNIGKLTRLDGNGRVRVLLELLNSRIPVTLDLEGLEAA